MQGTSTLLMSGCFNFDPKSGGHKVDKSRVPSIHLQIHCASKVECIVHKANSKAVISSRQFLHQSDNGLFSHANSMHELRVALRSGKTPPEANLLRRCRHQASPARAPPSCFLSSNCKPRASISTDCHSFLHCLCCLGTRAFNR